MRRENGKSRKREVEGPVAKNAGKRGEADRNIEKSSQNCMRQSSEAAVHSGGSRKGRSGRKKGVSLPSQIQKPAEGRDQGVGGCTYRGGTEAERDK